MKLYEITKANAEAMSIESAEKYLAEEAAYRKERPFSEAYDRSISGYVLDTPHWHDIEKIKRPYDYDETNELGKEAVDVFKALVRRGVPHSKLMTIDVGDAFALDPEVKKILEKKVDSKMDKFKSQASDSTKRQFESASPERKASIFSAWTKKHEEPKPFARSSKFDAIRSLRGDNDGGRRKSRRSRKTRKVRKTRSSRR